MYKYLPNCMSSVEDLPITVPTGYKRMVSFITASKYGSLRKSSVVISSSVITFFNLKRNMQLILSNSLKSVVAHRHKRVTVNATGYGFDSHRKCNI